MSEQEAQGPRVANVRIFFLLGEHACSPQGPIPHTNVAGTRGTLEKHNSNQYWTPVGQTPCSFDSPSALWGRTPCFLDMRPPLPLPRPSPLNPTRTSFLLRSSSPTPHLLLHSVHAPASEPVLAFSIALHLARPLPTLSYQWTRSGRRKHTPDRVEQDSA